MGLFFKTSEEKAASQRKKDEIMEKGTSYMGYPLQNLGPITTGSVVTIKMHPDEQKISLTSGKNSIDLPYDRILGFSIGFPLTKHISLGSKPYFRQLSQISASLDGLCTI